jgi:hypothetical protein
MMWATRDLTRRTVLGCAVSLLALAAGAEVAAAGTPCPSTTVAGAMDPIYSSPDRSDPIVFGWLPIYRSVPTYPMQLSPPVISGTATPGSTLTASTGTWSSPVPLNFEYEWVRCVWECDPISHADAATYTLTPADAITTSGGWTSTIFAVVYAKGDDGSELNVSSCGVEASLIVGPAGELPRLLAHNGYTASYYALQPGRVDVAWTIDGDPFSPKLAHGSIVFRHGGRRRSFKVRLTKLGRRMLAHHRSLTIQSDAEYTPPNRVGGDGVVISLTLSVDTPALHT